MTLYVYVDNSNIWIEGKRVSAVRKGLVTNISQAITKGILDRSWSYDFGRLYKAVCPDEAQIGRSALFGSRPPEDDSVWEAARHRGFEVEVFDRNAANKEKGVDSAIITMMLEDSYQHMKSDRGDKVVLVAGDRDYVPPVKALASRGFKTHVVCWRHATGKELIESADDFTALDDFFDYLSR